MNGSDVSKLKVLVPRLKRINDGTCYDVFNVKMCLFC